MTLGQKLKAARKKSEYTQMQLAELVGVKKSSISNWERDLNRPSTDMVQKLCDVLGVQPGYFFENGGTQQQLEGVRFALWGEIDGLDEAAMRDVLQFVQYIREKRQQE